MSIEYPPLINEIVQKLDARQPLPPLAPEKEWDAELTKQIHETSTTELFDGRVLKDPSLANAVKSALLLWNDALDDSHDISQDVRSKTGSYWHGIMHPARTGLQQFQILVCASGKPSNLPGAAGARP